MSSEDKMVNLLIDSKPSEWNPNFDPEVSYNDYGSRGVVDLVGITEFHHTEWQIDWLKARGHTNVAARNRQKAIEIYEIKSEYAIKNATGANEVIRQCKSHEQHFFNGSEYDRSEYDYVDWILHVENTPMNILHLYENMNMYKSLDWHVYLLDYNSEITCDLDKIYDRLNDAYDWQDEDEVKDEKIAYEARQLSEEITNHD